MRRCSDIGVVNLRIGEEGNQRTFILLLNIALTHRQKIIAWFQSREISHTAWIHVVQILKRWTSVRRLELHQWGRRLGTPQHESEPAFRSV